MYTAEMRMFIPWRRMNKERFTEGDVYLNDFKALPAGVTATWFHELVPGKTFTEKPEYFRIIE
jgi:hypothetical protein